MRDMTALIFGVGGQDGYYLSQLLRSENTTVIGVSRSPGAWIIGDVADRQFVDQTILRYRPTYIFHLAANSTTRYDAMFENHVAISTGTLNILDAVLKHSPESRVFLSGSGLQFVNTGQPISEDDPFEASSAYAVARIQSVYAARYFRELGLKTYVGYFFNHESPRRARRHISQEIVHFARSVAYGSDGVLEIGDPSVEKEYTFAGDVARAILLLTKGNEVHEAVIGSGRAYSIEQWLDICFGLHGLSWQGRTRLKEGFVAEYHRLVSNPSTMFARGWRPETDIVALARLMTEAL
jgi:GDPmannose 4,6-dehydratase